MALFCFQDFFPLGHQTFLGLHGDLNAAFLTRQHLELLGSAFSHFRSRGNPCLVGQTYTSWGSILSTFPGSFVFVGWIMTGSSEAEQRSHLSCSRQDGLITGWVSIRWRRTVKFRPYLLLKGWKSANPSPLAPFKAADLILPGCKQF